MQAKVLTPVEARRIAVNIARLLELLKREERGPLYPKIDSRSLTSRSEC
jgi:hypothetical protein